MTGAFVSDFTKKTLMQFGWRDGDLIPAALGEFLLAAKDRAKPSSRTDVMIDIEAMMPEDVEAVKQILNDGRSLGEKQKEEESLREQTKNMAPSVAMAYMQMMQQEKEQQDQGPQIIDDRDDAEAEKQPAPAAEDATPEPQAQEETKTVAEEQTPPEPPPPPPVVLPFCPRCGWDMRMKYDVEVTDADKEAFVAILLGNSRFKKKYSLLNDKFIFTLRSLFADENTEIHRQLVLDYQAGELPSENEWFLRMFEYRLACSLESAYDGKGKPLAIIPPLAEMDYKPPPERPLETGLVYLRKYVNTQVLAHEVTRRMVGQQFRRFQRLIEALEAVAVEPSFWEGIG